MKVLVTGGAGYIGSQVVHQALEQGHGVIVLDNLLTGHRWAVDERAVFVEGDLRDTDLVTAELRQHGVDAVMNFAGSISVGESVGDPLKYWNNNAGGMTSLLQAMKSANVDKLVFSSTAALFGKPSAERIPIGEDVPCVPINPYGQSKLVCEQMIANCVDCGWLSAVPLRYFNACGAPADAVRGEAHPIEEHLIPNVLNVALGINDKVTINGDDFPTEDGTCVRDYIHIEDLATAHLLALDWLANNSGFCPYNLGSGSGYSVLQIVEAARRVTGHQIPAQFGPRRAGDPPTLIADSTKIRDQLAWDPQWTELDQIIDSAWRWAKKHYTQQ